MTNIIRDTLRPVMRLKRDRARNDTPWQYHLWLAILIGAWLGFWIWVICMMPSCARAEVYDAYEICDAIYIIEGGKKAKKPYGILSVSCHGETGCRQVCINTVQNEFMRWQAGDGRASDYLESLARRYAPVNSDTDNGTNQFWLKNLKWYLAKIGGD